MTFAQRVSDQFDLGTCRRPEPMASGANLLWKIGRYIVKELPADDIDAITKAADPDLFAHFMHGHGRTRPPIRLADWVKWLSDLGSWFEFMARQSAGDYAATARDRKLATDWALEALTGIANAIEQIPDWCDAINRRL
jgi:hypothetical protein